MDSEYNNVIFYPMGLAEYDGEMTYKDFDNIYSNCTLENVDRYYYTFTNFNMMKKQPSSFESHSKFFNKKLPVQQK